LLRLRGVGLLGLLRLRLLLRLFEVVFEGVDGRLTEREEAAVDRDAELVPLPVAGLAHTDRKLVVQKLTHVSLLPARRSARREGSRFAATCSPHRQRPAPGYWPCSKS